MLAGLVVGFIVLLATSKGLKTVRGGRVGGDLPAFYGAARIVRAGDTAHLYDALTQEGAEADLLPETGGRLPFPYPPYVALAYVPLTFLPFKVAFALHATVMALCAVAAIAWLRPLVPGLRGALLPAVAALLTSYPMVRSVLGGQNTGLSLLCAAAAARDLARGRDLQAGLWLGAWLFKPQFAVPVTALLLIRAGNRIRLLAGFAAVGILYYLIGWAMAGWDWPLWWYHEGAMAFTVADYAVDRGNGISFAEIAEQYGVTPLKWVASAIAAALSVWIVRKRRLHIAAAAAIATGLAVLIAPHTLYYDGALGAPGVIAAAAFDPSTLPLIAGLWLLSWLQPLAIHLPLPPLTIVMIASMYIAAGVKGVNYATPQNPTPN